MMPDSPRVFVSSIMGGYTHVREAARRGIEAAGGKPILVEDLPSLPTSPRNACLDLIQSCDALVLIVGPRGGFRAPSGKLVVEEEYDEARRLGLPTWVFVDTTRDAEASTLEAKVSNFTSGMYRRDFGTPEELEALCRQSLGGAMTSMSRTPFDVGIIQEALKFKADQLQEPRVRLVLAPSVHAEVVDPLQFDSDQFHDQLLVRGHETKFLSYQFGKTPQASSSALVIEEADRQGRTPGPSCTIIATTGLVTLEKQVSTADLRQHRSDNPWAGFEIATADLQAAVHAAFRFGAQILDSIDPHQRYPAWLYGVALSTGSRRIVDTPTRGSTFRGGLGGSDVIRAFDEPRQLSRSALANPDDEIVRVVKLLRKRADENSSPF